MSAEEKIAQHNHRLAQTKRFQIPVCAACGVDLGDMIDQRVDGWPVCEPCFVEE